MLQVRGLKPLHLQLAQSSSPDPLSHSLLDDPTLGEDCERLICNECARPLAKKMACQTGCRGQTGWLHMICALTFWGILLSLVGLVSVVGGFQYSHGNP